MKLFISYSRHDISTVEKLADVLRSGGHEVWYVQKLLPGVDREDELRNEIRNCDEFVYVLSNTSTASTWCQWEFAEALRHDKPIIPILIQATDLPEALENVQYADFTEGINQESMAELTSLATKIAKEAAEKYPEHLPIPKQSYPFPPQTTPCPFSQPVPIRMETDFKRPFGCAIKQNNIYVTISILVVVLFSIIILGDSTGLRGTSADGPPDNDGDGVADDVDQCPNKGDTGNGVDENGCPLAVVVTEVCCNQTIICWHGQSDFVVSVYDLSQGTYHDTQDCDTPDPLLTLIGQCDVATLTTVFTVTNTGGPMTSPTGYTASDGQSGEFEPLDTGESMTFAVQPIDGASTFLVGEFGLVESLEGCNKDFTVCGPTAETRTNGFPIIDTSNPVVCSNEQVAHLEWTPVEVGGSVCPDWLVYHTKQTGDWEVFRLGKRGSIPTDWNPNLTQGVGERIYDIAPSRSPDAAWIAFASNRDGNWEIYLGNAEGTEQRRVTFAYNAIDKNPMWSPVGDYLAFESSRDGNWELYLVDLSTGTETRLTTDPSSDLNPFWLPDGTKLLFESDRDGLWQIYELDITDITQPVVTQLTDGMFDAHAAQYSHDGTLIAFYAPVGEDNNNVIHVMNADGTEIEAISDPAGNATNHSFSPQDEAIGYQSDLDGDLDIYVYEFSSEETRLVTDNDISDYTPVWYCDSTIVVFTSDITGDANIFETPALPIDVDPIDVEAAANQLTNAPEADQYP